MKLRWSGFGVASDCYLSNRFNRRNCNRLFVYTFSLISAKLRTHVK